MDKIPATRGCSGILNRRNLPFVASAIAKLLAGSRAMAPEMARLTVPAALSLPTVIERAPRADPPLLRPRATPEENERTVPDVASSE